MWTSDITVLSLVQLLSFLHTRQLRQPLQFVFVSCRMRPTGRSSTSLSTSRNVSRSSRRYVGTFVRNTFDPSSRVSLTCSSSKTHSSDQSQLKVWFQGGKKAKFIVYRFIGRIYFKKDFKFLKTFSLICFCLPQIVFH